MPDDIIARAEAALEGVTDGPWSCYGNMAHEVFQEPTADSEGADVAHSVCHIEDSRFIAAARTLVPALVAELKAARAELDGARATIAHMTEAMCWISGHDRTGQDHLNDAMRLAQQMDAIRLAHSEYEAALERREHGAVAAGRLIDAVAGQLTEGMESDA